MNQLVKILSDDDGYPREKEEQVWHLVDPADESGNSTLCEKEYFGLGESGCTYLVKKTARGGITCKKCLKSIKAYKSVKL